MTPDRVDEGVSGGPRDLLAGTVAALREHPRASAAAAALLLAGVLLAFGGVLGHEFVNWDDRHYLPSNPRLAMPPDGESLRWILTDRSAFYWHPVAYLLAAAQNGAFGAAAGPRHAVSLALHGVNVLLVFLLALAVLRGVAAGSADAGGRHRVAAAAVAAALWGLHPLRAEPVAWHSEQKELLCTGFFLAACLAWIGRCTAGDPRSARRRAVAVHVLALLALASKPMAITLPGALLALDVLPLGRLRSAADVLPRLREKGLLLVLCAGILVLNLTGPKEQDRHSSPKQGPDPVVRAVVPLWGFSVGVVHTAWPANLHPVYPYPHRGDIRREAGKYVLGMAVLACATVAVVLAARRRGTLAPAVAWAAYAGLTLPVSGLRRLGSIETADRFTYLPTIPLLLLAGGGIAAAIPRLTARGRGILVASTAGTVLALGTLAAAEVAVWRNSETLWTSLLRDMDSPPLAAYVNMGTMRYEQARVALREGRRGDAEALMEASERLLAAALRVDPSHPTTYLNLGLLDLMRGRPHTAEGHFRRAVELAPAFTAARVYLGTTLARLGRRDEARAACAEALREPGSLPPALLQAARSVLAGERVGGDPGEGE